MKYLYLVLAILLICEALKGQEKIFIPSPQTYSFVQYGNIPVNHFSGETNVTIPIYTYEDKDFNIPIYLGYNSSGFKPTQNEGIVGLNWYLNAGGAILRTINGEPDDQKGNPSGTAHGFFCGVKESSGFRGLTQNEKYIMNYTSTDLLKFWFDSKYELQPDKFTFNAPGLNGSFFINNDGSVVCDGNKAFKVDLSNLALQSFEAWSLNESSIIITGDNGYIYHFGGTLQHLEYSQPLSPSFLTKDYDINGGYEYTKGAPVILAWHLTKIEAPNGRKVIYNYRNFIVQDKYTASDSEHYIFNKIYTFKNTSNYRKTKIGVWKPIYSVSGTVYDGYSYSATKTVYLDYIKIDDTKIIFDYATKSNKFHDGAIETSSFNQFNLQLSNIRILHGTSYEPVKWFLLEYSYKDRLFLSSVKENGSGKYYFLYYDNDTVLPNPTTRGIDHWGFWNGRDNNATTVPFAYFDEDGNETYDETDMKRTPSEIHSKSAMLRYIIYPTGGKTEFIYEMHDYSLRLERRSEHNFLPHLYPVNGYSGGVRIKEIVNYGTDGQTILSGKKFKYLKSGTNTPSGILLEWPEYYVFRVLEDGVDLWINLMFKGDNVWSNHFPGEKYIQYSEVLEYPINDDKTFTCYKYSNYESNPDISEYKTFIANLSSYNIVPENLKAYSLSYPGIKLTDLSAERGKLVLSQKFGFYNNNKVKVEEIENEYTNYTNNPACYITAVQGTGYASQSYRIRHSHNLIKKTTKTTYSPLGTNPITDSVCYTYNSNGYMISAITRSSSGDELKTIHKYPFNFTTTPYTSMVAKNIIAPIIETTTTRGSATEKITTNYFNPSGNIFVPQTVQQTIGTTWTTKLTYNSYDDKGNVTQYTGSDGVVTTIFWGYNKTYPVAKVVSGNPHSIPAIRRDSVNNIAFRKSDIKAQIDLDIKDLTTALKMYVGDNNYQVTLYTYKPLVGMTSETIANIKTSSVSDSVPGVTTYYKYDTFGRLSEVRDDEGRLIKNHSYNYANQ